MISLPPLHVILQQAVAHPDLIPRETVQAVLHERLRLNKYMGGKTPTIKQMAFMLAENEEVLYGGGKKGGKALTLETPLPTPTGWTTMGAVQVGDWLLDEQGRPCQVQATTGIMHDHAVYDVVFDDGTVICADGDHRWLTMTHAERRTRQRHTPAFRAQRRATRALRSTGLRPDLAAANAARAHTYLSIAPGMVRTTCEIQATLADRHTIALCQPLDLPEYPLPVDPYVLGVWLGDGTAAGGGITSDDLEIVAAVAAAGVPIHKRSGPYDYGTYGLTTQLRAAGVLNNKHIPPVYLRASIAQRQALLQGLMDTDGTVDARGQCEFSVTQEPLARGVCELLHSLGVRTRLCTGRARIYGKDCGPRYRLKFMAPFPAFRLPRKLTRQVQEDRGHRRHRTIVAVRPAPSVPVKCITVSSPSHLYLAGPAMIPTHNSEASLFASLQYVDVPDYNALILRRTYQQLSKAEGLIPRAHKWLDRTDAHWSEESHTWTFPTGATLAFGYVDDDTDYGDVLNFQGTGYQFIDWEELTQWATPAPYLAMFSCLLPLTGSAVPLRMRGTANPGGKGHAWVKERFLGPAAAAEGRLFIEALVGDNPHVDAARIQHAYRNLSAVQQAQYLHGDWGVEPTGDLFAVDKIVPIPRVPATGVLARWRGWDKAGTDAEAKRAKYAKYTAGARLSRVDPRQYGVEWVIEDLVRGQWSAGARETRIRYVAKGDVEPLAQVTHAVGTFDATRPDPPGTVVLLEQEGGSGGKESAEASIRNLARVDARLYLPSGDKEARARPLAAQMEAGNVGMVIGPWNEQVRQVLRAAPKGVYWDEIDALSMIFNAMAALPTVPPPLAVSTTPDWAALGFRPL